MFSNCLDSLTWIESVICLPNISIIILWCSSLSIYFWSLSFGHIVSVRPSLSHILAYTGLYMHKTPQSLSSWNVSDLFTIAKISIRQAKTETKSQYIYPHGVILIHFIFHWITRVLIKEFISMLFLLTTTIRPYDS